MILDSHNYIIKDYDPNTLHNRHANHIPSPHPGGLYKTHSSLAPTAHTAMGQNDGLPNGKAQHLLERLDFRHRTSHYKQAFIGKLFGKIAMRKILKLGTPLDKNIPTSAQFIMKDPDGDLEAEKQKWISLINAYEQFNNPQFIHDFFGPMTQEQIGVLVYKHTDHHLRQFGV